MRPPSPPSPSKTPAGFTLTELLVTIAIIAILAAILVAVLGKVEVSARKVQVVNDMKNMKVALISYYTDYRKYPINDIQQSATDYEQDDTVYGDPNGQYWSADLFDILRAQADNHFNDNDKYNPSGTVYWPGPFVKNPSKPVGGITSVDYTPPGGDLIHAGGLVDPWGHEYVIWIDCSKDSDLSIAAHWFYNDVSATPGTLHTGEPPLGIEMGSLGPDGQFGTKGNHILANSDDIVTWRQ